MARGRAWTEEEFMEFRNLVADGLSNNQLAQHYRVSVSRISQLRAQCGVLIRPRKVKDVVGIETNSTALPS